MVFGIFAVRRDERRSRISEFAGENGVRRCQRGLGWGWLGAHGSCGGVQTLDLITVFEGWFGVAVQERGSELSGSRDLWG